MNTTHTLNDEVILTSIKKLLLIDETYTVFDEDIRLHINTIFSNLCQMGVGPLNGFVVLNGTETWADFGFNEPMEMQQIKTYVYLKVRLLFDPPQNASLLESINKQAAELEYRLYTRAGGY